MELPEALLAPFRKRSCSKKVKFPTEKIATKVLQAKCDPKHLQRMHVYQCNFCGGWHIGHQWRGRKRGAKKFSITKAFKRKAQR